MQQREISTLVMRACSSVSVGLWSVVIANAVPVLEQTQRESPALATVRVLPRTRATTCGTSEERARQTTS